MAVTAEKRSVFNLMVHRELAAIVTFVVLALFSEFRLVYSFFSLGLVDSNAWFVNLGVFAFGISPLLYLVPLTVIVVLFCSWVYLTKYSIYVPARADIIKRPLTKRELEKRRFKFLRRFSRRTEKRLQGFSSNVFKWLHLANAKVRGGFIVLIIFLSLSLLLLVVIFPNLIYNLAVGLYIGNSAFLHLVRDTSSLARGFGDVLASVFIGVAPDFHNSLTSVGSSLTGSIVQLDVASKYLLSQNIAAWAAALIALGYGIYYSSLRQKKR